MKEKRKTPIFKKKWFWIVIVVLVVASIASNAGKDDSDAADNTEPVQSAKIETEEPAETEQQSGSIKSGTFTLPCGMKINFSDSVRNDVTGNWRLASTSDSFTPADYALEYYNEMFSSDDEIHGIWNATLGTMTKISASGNLLFIDTFEYVDGEEHDAKLMFSGTLLDSRIIDKETGEAFSDNEEPSDDQSILDLDTVMSIARISLSQNFGEDNYTLEYDDTGATINIWGDNIALGATLAVSGDKDAKESWDNLVDSQKALCNTFVDQVESIGIKNYYITLNVLNDANKSNTLLTVLNGVVVYDAVNS